MRGGGGGGGGGVEGIIKLMLGEGEWNNLGPGGLNKIGACPGGICKSVPGGGGGRYHISLSRGGYILFPGGGGGGGEEEWVCLQLFSL